MEARKLVVAGSVSARTLADMNRAVNNFKRVMFSRLLTCQMCRIKLNKELKHEQLVYEK